jgi:hypothetical protein
LSNKTEKGPWCSEECEQFNCNSLITVAVECDIKLEEKVYCICTSGKYNPRYNKNRLRMHASKLWECVGTWNRQAKMQDYILSIFSLSRFLIVASNLKSFGVNQAALCSRLIIWDVDIKFAEIINKNYSFDSVSQFTLFSKYFHLDYMHSIQRRFHCVK